MSDEIGEGPVFDRELPKQGSCSARVWKSFNVGLQPQKVGNPSPKVVIYFILPYKYTTGDFKGKRILIKQMYTAGFGKKDSKNYLRRDVQAILNRTIEDKELPLSMPKVVWGQPCLIQIIHENGYANIKTVMSLPDGMPGLEADPQADPSDDHIPAYVEKLREKTVVQERADTDQVAEKGWQAGAAQTQAAPTEKEAEKF